MVNVPLCVRACIVHTYNRGKGAPCSQAFVFQDLELTGRGRLVVWDGQGGLPPAAHQTIESG